MDSHSPEPRSERVRPVSGYRLNSWKEIAAFLGTTERTVQRWEKAEGLPVHRHLHSKRGTVYAFNQELEAWRAARHSGNAAEASSRHPLWRRSWRWIFAAGVLSGVAAAVLWLSFPSKSTLHPPLEAIPLTSYPGRERQPSFSPDGRFVAFSWVGMDQKNQDIYIKPVEGGDPVRLTSHPAAESDPVWSPDGRSIAFLRSLGAGRTEVLIVPARGGAERLLLTQQIDRPFGLEWFYVSHLAWSPDGRSLVIPEKSSRQESIGLSLLSIDTGRERRLTSPPPTYIGDSDPAFSPDGHTLAFIRTISTFISELYVVSLGGGAETQPEPRRLTAEKRWIGGAVWTPDGREIVCSIGEVVNRSLFRIAVPSTGGPIVPPTKISGASWNSFYGFAISWARQRLVYAREDYDLDIWRQKLPESVVPAGATDTSAQLGPATRFLSSTLEDLFPQFSPDGRRIAFMSHRSGKPEIWVSGSDGLNPRQITAVGGGMKGVPRWSPDSGYIVFDSRLEEQSDIFVMDASGGQLRRLTHGPAENLVPSWSRDGQWIYFVSRRTGTPQIWKVPASGGAQVQITRNGGFGGFESVDHRFLYYAKAAEKTSLWKVPVDGGEETQILGSLDNFANFAVTERGLYFSPVPAADAPPSIQFFSFDTGRSSVVAAMRMPLDLGLSVSPDGRWILYTQIERQGSDLMLIENFRLR